MGPIFNKKVTKKCNLWDREQYTYALFTIDKVNYCGLEKKKRRGKRGEENVNVPTKRSQCIYDSGFEKERDGDNVFPLTFFFYPFILF